MSTGKKMTAPCGHEGEAVIGAYVRCLQGCAKDPRNQPAAKPRRGEPGHVDFCACKPCTLRRRGVEIVLRTKSGKETRVPWDGISNAIRWTAAHKDNLRHWKIVDVDGDELADGMCDVEMMPGDPMRIDIETLMDPAKLAVKRDGCLNKRWVKYKMSDGGGWWGAYADHVEKTNQAVARAYGLPEGVLNGYPSKEDGWYSAITGVGKPQGYKGLRQVAKSANFGMDYLGLSSTRSAWGDIRRAALTCAGVTQVQVLSLVHGQIDVVITETEAYNEVDENVIYHDVEKRLRDVVAAGIHVRVHLQTPMRVLSDVLKGVGRELHTRWVKIDRDYCKDLEQMISTALKSHYSVAVVVSQRERGEALQVEVRYDDALGRPRYVSVRIGL